MTKQYAAQRIMLVVALIALSSSSAFADLCDQIVFFEIQEFPTVFDREITVVCGQDDAVRIGETFEIDIEESSIHLDFLETTVLNPQLGLIFDHLTWGVPGTIVNATINPASTAVPTLIQFDADTVAVAFGGVSVQSGQTTWIDIEATHVPEPTTWLLFSTGLGGLLVDGWRRRKAAKT